MDYFTWDSGLTKPEKVCTSIKVAMSTLYLLSNLRSSIRDTILSDKDENTLRDSDIQMMLRKEVMASFFERAVGTGVAREVLLGKEKQIERLVTFDFAHIYCIDRRIEAIETCLFEDLLSVLKKMDIASTHIEPYIENIRSVGLYFNGYSQGSHVTDVFLTSDGMLFQDNIDAHKSLVSKAWFDIYELSEEVIEGVYEVIEAPLWPGY